MKEIGYKEYGALLAAYAVSISALYLLGFWGAFQLNIMQYAALSDLVKLAAFPLAATFLLNLVGMVHQDLTLSASLPVGGGSESRIAKLVRRYAALISVLWMGACVLTILLVKLTCSPI
ncbi:hypothetical protein [Herbaspirillum sp. VT-16-41]|uniref:hypothetical protein n=1 Tax=Herbaspirillum sp. VT-16-41 TaxID=1953765 RepID=UPI0009815B03|nr:hypothetical protein [Herbaspirillum sp. VT-16-41]ONN67869.1 hypothetical protein BTM36_04145 [Herbaspirillum sp. VT-16-41]